MTVNKMSLESLSNELFLDLFELFNAIDLLRSFRDLNTRINSLLFIHFRTYRLDLRSIFKEDFDVFYRKYLPSLIDRIIYLRLSDDDDTPYQCIHLLTAGLTLGRFDNLRYLSLYKISSDPKINQSFFSDFHRLHHLTHLKFVDCQLYHVDGNDFQDVIDQIWNLPKLTHCYWELSFKGTSYFCTPNFVSTSLQYLTILENFWHSSGFTNLLKKTPCLRMFYTSLDTYEEDDIPPSREFLPLFKNLSVKKLILFKVDSQRLMTNLFQLLPNVNHLKIELIRLKFNGYQWEQIIINYFPQLKVLQFLMDFSLCPSTDDQNHEAKVDQYLATYRTPFWIEHHQCFIRCRWRAYMENVSIRVYSLPYKFDYFPIYYKESNSSIKSTCPSEMHFSYDSVCTIAYQPWLFNDDALFHVQLININILNVQLPIDRQFLSNIPRLENLYMLVVNILTTNYQSHLQTLLDSAPHLYSLLFESWTTSAMPPYRCTSTSVCLLDVAGSDQSHRRQCYDTQQCIELSRSPLGIQCRVLTIRVEDSESIFELINSMVNLRTLNVSYEHDSRNNRYDCLQLLQYYLPRQHGLSLDPIMQSLSLDHKLSFCICIC